MRSDPVKNYYSHSLQGNVPLAIRSLPRSSTNEKTKRFIRKMRARFVTQDESARISSRDPFVRSIVAAYQTYYRQALLNLKEAEKYELQLKQILVSDLSKFRRSISKNSTWEKIEKLLEHEMRQRGYYCLVGRVAPLRSLLIWKKQTSRKFKVKLLSGIERVDVVILDDFVELGWLHYATLGRYYVGGWAKPKALFCVARAYKRNFDSDTFKASYLAHEAQHFADYKTFPRLAQTDLEYRAKLAEIIAFPRPKKRLKFFRSEARCDPSKPHSFAAFQIIRRFDSTEVTSASELAVAMLEEHTVALHREGRKTVRSVLVPKK